MELGERFQEAAETITEFKERELLAISSAT